MADSDDLRMRVESFVAISFLGVTAMTLSIGRAAEITSEDKRLSEMSKVEGSIVQKGRSLFLKNCAHCHGDDASGDEGPDLHGLKQSDGWIEKRISNGIKGEMPAFREKFNSADVSALVQFLRGLK